MSRYIDPVQDAERIALQEEGWRTQGDLLARDDAALRSAYDERKPLLITQETMLWYRGAVGGSGNTAYLMRSGLPDTDATWAMSNEPEIAPAQGRILFVRLTSSEAVTAGTIQARIRVIEGADTTDYTFEECELSTTHPRTRAAVFDWPVAKQIAADATMQARVVTAGSMTPTTIDVRLTVVIGYQTWV